MISLLPEPQQCEYGVGTCTLRPGDGVLPDSGLQPEFCRKIEREVQLWIETLGFALCLETSGEKTVLVSHSEKTDGSEQSKMPDEEAYCSVQSKMQNSSVQTKILLRVDDTLLQEMPFGDQGYRLAVDTEGICIDGASEIGLFYGLQTFRQILMQCGSEVPCLKILDYPDLAVRGYYHDVTRGRVPKMSWLKTLVDRLACYKINQLQLYVEHSFAFEGLEEVWQGQTPLTAEDILELDAYCRDRYIDFVPSLASFGHMYEILRSHTWCHLGEFPELAEEPFGFFDRLRHHTLDASRPESLAFAIGLIDRYMSLFSSKYFNICGDETFDLGKGKSKPLAEQIGTQRLYLNFLKALCQHVADQGKTPMFWGDIVQSFPEAVEELPEGTICLNWGYEPDQEETSTRELAEAGARLYCCPGVCGWDQLVNRMEDSWENITRMCAYAHKYGAEGVLNTDWGDCGHINHPDFSMPDMIYGAVYSWKRKPLSEKEVLDAGISRLEYGETSGKLVAILSRMPDFVRYGWRNLVDRKEGRASEKCAPAMEQLQGWTKGLQNLCLELKQLKLPEEQQDRIDAYELGIRGTDLLQRIYVKLAYGMEMPMDGTALSDELVSWFENYELLWHTVSRDSELYRIREVIDWCKAELLS